MMSLDTIVTTFGEKTLVPIGLAALIVMLAVWLTRLDDKVNYQQQQIGRVEKCCSRQCSRYNFDSKYPTQEE